MNKILLLVSILSSISIVSAQQKSLHAGNHTSTICNVIPLAPSSGEYNSYDGTTRRLSYDKDINSITYMHMLSDLCDSTNGYFTYDVSTNGGTTWSLNQPPIYGPQSSHSPNCATWGSRPGHRPLGMIYNPAGNTNPNAAHLPYAGVWYGTPGGKLNGTGHLNLSAPNENYDSLSSGNAISPEDIFITKTGTSWIIGELENSFAYADTLVILRGAWNGSDFVYTYYPVHYVTPNNAGFLDMKVVFNDNGQTGYIAMISNPLFISVLKTTDGGNSWSCPTDIDVSTGLDSALKNQGALYQTGMNLDIVIDMNDNLHIITHISEYNSQGWYLQYPYGENGTFDIYTTDGGNTYYGQLLAHPQTVGASFGTQGVDEIIQFQRHFASRTWDGSKLFFGFFDTDTMTFGIFENLNPDLRLIGYDVVTNKWTADLSNLQNINSGENITTGSNADGICTFGNGSYYSIDNGGTYSVPVSYARMNSGLPFDNFYIDCAAPTGSFTYDGHPLSLTVSQLNTLCDGGDGVVLSTNELKTDLIVSSNYPNPFTGKTSVDVTLANAGEVSIEISNVVGQTLLSSNYKNLHAGLNTLTIDGSELSHGLYFFTVKAGISSVTRTMAVE